jgi:putative resolvase
VICAILNKMERIVAIGEAADMLGVSIVTPRRSEAAGKLAAEHMAGGHRRDDVAK